MKMFRRTVLTPVVAVSIVVAMVVVTDAAATKSTGLQVDKNLPSYKQTTGVSGSIKSVGSDTMNNLMTLWAESYKKMYPALRIEIEGKGSSTAPPGLIAGTSTFGPMSRKMKDKEVDAFEKKFGYKPTPLPTSIDMLAVPAAISLAFGSIMFLNG